MPGDLQNFVDDLAFASLQLLLEGVRCTLEEGMSDDMIEATATLCAVAEREDGTLLPAVFALARAAAAMIVNAEGDQESADFLLTQQIHGALSS